MSVINGLVCCAFVVMLIPHNPDLGLRQDVQLNSVDAMISKLRTELVDKLAIAEAEIRAAREARTHTQFASSQ